MATQFIMNITYFTLKAAYIALIALAVLTIIICTSILIILLWAIILERRTRKMPCNLYIKLNDKEVRVGQFRNQESAEIYWERSKHIYRQKDGTLGTPIYVKTKKGRGE